MAQQLAPQGLMEKLDAAIGLISQSRGVVVALSAGVDSSLVASLAHKALGDGAVAVTGVSESLPPEELKVARETARAIGIRHMIVHTREMENQDYSSNPQNRCYYCKETLYAELRKVADSLRLQSILDGTHLDDLGDDRPGLKAAREAGVISPLVQASFSKAEVRDAAKILGLSVWDKPAMPCLSSRIAHGEEITVQRLQMVGKAESFIKQLTGVSSLRVRYSNGFARIEVSPNERRAFFDERTMDRVDSELRGIGFARVTLDLGGLASKGKPVVHDELTLPMAGSTH